MIGWRLLTCTAVLAALAACGGGGSGKSSAGADPTPASCSGTCADTSTFLTVADIETVIAQAVFEAQALGVSNVGIAVVDRVGNVLAFYRLGMGAQTVLIASQQDTNGDAVISGGLEGIAAPLDDQAAIAKAVTGAYLSSEGNAFSTRTASQIIQENFNPGERNQPSGPLFGVQFSQLACSDFTQAFAGGVANVGPKRSPLGLSADPGGLPLYKGGTPVGAVGVISDGLYTLDKVITNEDLDQDELIAVAATFGFAAPLDRRAERITLDGKTLRFSDAEVSDLASNPADAPPFSSLGPAIGALVAVNGYSNAVIIDGTSFGTPASGIRSDGDVNYPGRDAFVFVDDANVLRFPPRDATDSATLGPATLTAAEVRTVIDNALGVANSARAQIRRPVGSSARVTISVVDTLGQILGMARTRDAPVFGADVSLQKARTAAFLSSAAAADFLRALPDAAYLTGGVITIGDYVDAAQAFFADPNALEDGAIAFSDRAGGNVSRPFFPDGLGDRDPGPFSKSRGQWSVFSTGMQYDVDNNAILQHVLFVAGLGATDVGPGCAGVDSTGTQTVLTLQVGNGLQIFPGSVPIYRDGTLVGGIGISGDGVDQDDMIAFLGLHNGGIELSGALNNAPPAIRADTLTPQGTRLRFVQCPQAPFIDSDEQNPCEGK